MPRKYLSILVILCLMIGMVSALSISADSPLVQGQQWSFEADLSSLENGQEASFYIGSEEIYVVAKTSDKYFKIDASPKVLLYSSYLGEDSGQLTLVVSRMSEGTYTLKVESDDDSDEVEIDFYQLANMNDFERLKTDFENLKVSLENLEKENKDKDEEISNLLSQISILSNENSSLNASLDSLNSKLKLLEQQGKTSEEIVSELKEDLNILIVEREEARKNLLTGMFAFGSENSGFLIGIIALIALIVVGVFIKSRTSSIYDVPILNKGNVVPFEDDVSEKKVKRDSPIKGLLNKIYKSDGRTEVKEASPKKKWAVESYSPSEKKQESKSFELGDLIKKN
jgi:chaperonin cofactor prefoldin